MHGFDFENGDNCIYTYKGPHGFALKPNYFSATILGFTEKRIKIKAYDHINKCEFTSTVRPGSLRKVEES